MFKSSGEAFLLSRDAENLKLHEVYYRPLRQG
jgi:hypothetical protein